MIPFQTLILYVASSLHLPFPCRLSAYHFTSLSAIHILLIIPHPFPPPSFHLQPSTLSSLCSFVITSICTQLCLKTPKDNSYFLNFALRDIWQRREGNREGKGKRERVVMRKLFHSIRRGYTLYVPRSSCTYLQYELNKKNPPPLLFGFASRYKV